MTQRTLRTTNFGWTVIFSKNAQTIKDFFETVLMTAKRKADLIETDIGKEFVNKIIVDC